MATEIQEQTGLSESGGASGDGRAAVQERPQENPGRFQRYRLRTGMTAWIMHRLSGVALVVYLALHIWGLRALTDRAAYNALIAKYHAPLYKIGEFLLLAAVVYHAMNGFRIVLIDLLGWSPNQKRLFWTLSFVALVLLGVGGCPSLYALYHWAF
jgi:succinate dehydrogenase / fumarate reductase cytochrome b subunit